ncbi:fucose permease [Saonia flava]|uniref:Fucose permease n=1 Tax=Saonia flava TaxID=523696 RepID=A0A846QRM3_9FLAO|nr:MFS transporter [Saonia flava]NJB70738.1 fucose permease [Saonia flava]
MKSLKLILSNPKYFGPSWVFASINILFGTWAIYIPIVKEKLEINNSELGIAIFCLALGTFTVFPIASKLITRFGVGKATRTGVLLVSMAAIFPLIAPSYVTLMVSLFFFGASSAFTDISMNTLVTEIEKEEQENFMSAAHGFFSLGGVLAGLGSFLIPLLNNPAIHMGIAIVLVVLVNVFFFKNYSHVTAKIENKEPFGFKNFKPLLLLGVVSFFAMGSEGAVIDWSGLFLKEVSLAPEQLIGTGFLAFSITMTLGRFLGDLVSTKIGSERLVTYGAILAILGFGLVLTAQTYIAIAGFGLIGLGFSAMVPELFRIGGNVNGVESSQGISFIAGTGYSGFLLAPVVLGFLAESYSLRITFITLLVCSVLILGASFLLKKSKISS